MEYSAKTTTIAILILALSGAAAIARAQDTRQEEKKDGKQDEKIDDRILKKESELEDLRRQIEEQRQKIRDLEKREKKESGYLKKLEDEERLTKRLLGALEDKRGMLEEQTARLREELSDSEKEYDERLAILSKRLREIYKDGSKQAWMELLAAEDFSDLLQRYKFLSLIAERDAALVEDLRDRKQTVERQEAEITEVLHEVTVSRNEKERELGKLTENERKRRKALEGVKADKKKYEKRVEELAAAEKKLQDIIGEMEKARKEQAGAPGDYGTGDFVSLKGRMPRPVDGTVSRNFGSFKHPEYGTVTYNTGIDIDTRAGEPVRAVARGRVEYAGELAGYGNCIIVNHGGGYYTLYAHASKVFVQQGSQVERGSLIAEAGEETEGAGATLHFEIRQSKKALDPAEWLVTGGQ